MRLASRGMLRSVRGRAKLAPCVLLSLAAAATAQTPNPDGSYPVPADWPLTPSGISATSGFRLIFVTSSTRNGLEGRIPWWNGFVQADAAAGHAAVRRYASLFRALASSYSVDARDNTNTNVSTVGAGVPIYWLNGDKVADNYNDFYDRSWDSYIRTDEHGAKTTTYGEYWVWTGSRSFGVKHPTTFFGNGEHGYSRAVKAGKLNSDPDTFADLKPIEFSLRPWHETHPVYGLSPVFKIDTSDRAWLTPTSLTVTEGATATYTVALNTDPTADVTVTVMSGDPSAVTVSPGTLTFTHGATGTWGAAQTVTVTAEMDADAVSEQDVSISHTATAATGPYSGKTIDAVEVDVTDSTAALVLSRDSLALSEGASGSYTVKLASAPAGDVTVTITGQGAASLNVTPSELTFSTTTWPQPRTVVVAAAQDNNLTNDSATLSHNASGGGYDGTNGTIAVTVTDDDEAGIAISPTTLDMGEGDSTTYTVRLSNQPSADMTVAISGHEGSSLTLDKTGLSFSPSAWSGARTITVTASQDDDLANESVTLNHAASGGGYDGTSGTIAVTVTDDDKASLVISPTTLDMAEGDSATYTVRLTKQPSADVTVAISGHEGSRLTLDKTSPSFSPSAWNSARTITVTARHDANFEDESVALNHAASGGGYDGATGTVDVNVTDDDKPKVSFALAEASVGEAAGRHNVTVNLRPAPDNGITLSYGLAGTAARGADYTIDGAAGDTGTVRVSGGASSADIAVALIDDQAAEASETIILTLTDGPGYVVGSQTIHSLTITDNDAKGGEGGGGEGGGGDGDGGGGGGGAGGGNSGGGNSGGGGGGGQVGQPKASFSVSGAECADALCTAFTGVPVTLEDTSAGGASRRIWDTGDGQSSRSSILQHAWSRPGFYRVTLRAGNAAGDSEAHRTILVRPSEPNGSCEPGDFVLCLLDERYSVEVAWRTSENGTGPAAVVREGTNDSGLFRFFDDANWEMLIKVLDACPINGHDWVFAASTTDLGYEITVSDTLDLAPPRIYRNEPGQPARAITDATAFPGGCQP